MYKRVLFAVDLEGVNNVRGIPYAGLSGDPEEYEKARHQAALEINCAANALFEEGAERVAVWDNHAGGKNIYPEELDSRIELLQPDRTKPRMYFAEGEFDCICFFGYHTMEGTLGGVLAHTMNSAQVQFYKINGKYVGEVDIDAYIAASHNMPAVFFAGGDLTCAQAKRSVAHIVTVTTKQELSRNEAIFRDNELLFADIAKAIKEAVKCEKPINPCGFLAEFQKSFKRMEDAEKYLERIQSQNIDADYLSDEILGKDAHTVVSKINNILELIICL